MVEPIPLQPDEQPWIGIDLGTTNTCVSLYNRNKNITEMIQIVEGGLTVPSIVTFKSDKSEIMVGKPAQQAMIKYYHNALYDAKRLIGRKYND